MSRLSHFAHSPTNQVHGSQRLSLAPAARFKLVAFILSLAAVIALAIFTISYNLKQPVKNGGTDLFQLFKDRFREPQTLPQ